MIISLFVNRAWFYQCYVAKEFLKRDMFCKRYLKKKHVNGLESLISISYKIHKSYLLHLVTRLQVWDDLTKLL